MLNIYLNTSENLFLDDKGNAWRDGTPEFTVGGKEEIHIFLKRESPDWGTSAAAPAEWRNDATWAEMSGISAMVTVDNDYLKYARGTLAGTVDAGVRVVTITFPEAKEELNTAGIIRLFSADGSIENIAYSDRVVNGNEVTFALDTETVKGYSAGVQADCTTSPYAQAYLDAERSSWEEGHLVFDLILDSARLRAENDYKSQEKVAILGMELLLYTTLADGAIQVLKAFLMDTATLRNVQGNPGFPAEVPDLLADKIAAAVERIAQQMKPVKGVDYWTAEDQEAIKNEMLNQGW